MEGVENVNRMLASFFRASSSILAFDAFPSNWINCSIMGEPVQEMDIFEGREET